MIWHYGSYVLAVFGLIGMWVVGKHRWGWLVSTCTQVLWLTYAVLTKQYGFIPGSTAYMVVYIRNFVRWKPQAANEEDSTVDDRQKELYRQVRYFLETSMPSADAEDAVAVLDELVKTVAQDADCAGVDRTDG